MGAAFGVEGADEAEFVGVPGEVGEEFADPHAALAVLLEAERGAEDGAEFVFRAADVTAVEWLAGVLVECRFRVEEVDLAGAAPHEEEDDALGAWGDVGEEAGGG